MDVSTPSWQQVKHIVGEALDLDEPDRAAFLEQACHDETLRGQVRSLLDRQKCLSSFLQRPLFTLRSRGDEPGRTIGPYRLLHPLGSGGMGQVYLAQRDDDPKHPPVALKLLRPGLERDEILRRFRLERSILAALPHPYVARWLDAGTTADGRPFLVMEHVPGEPLDAYCDARRLGTRERVVLMHRVCTAVHFVHQSGIVHCDLKPENVLVTAEGTPKLLDFGIAQHLERELGQAPAATEDPPTNAPLTLLYASPEQVSGGIITPASDIYTLGVLLYKLLTGHHPHLGRGLRPDRGTSPLRPSCAVSRPGQARRADGSVAVLTPESVSRVRDGDPQRLVQCLRGHLDRVVLKAMQPQPEQRYRSVEHLAVDLRRYLKKNSVSKST